VCVRCAVTRGLYAGVRRRHFIVLGWIRIEFQQFEQQQQHFRVDDCKRRACVHQRREQLRLQRHNDRLQWRQLIWRVDECLHRRIRLELDSRIVIFLLLAVLLRHNGRHRPCGVDQQLEFDQLFRCQSYVFTVPACFNFPYLTRVLLAENRYASFGSNVSALGSAPAALYCRCMCDAL
jgi:hypothetical protein